MPSLLQHALQCVADLQSYPGAFYYPPPGPTFTPCPYLQSPAATKSETRISNPEVLRLQDAIYFAYFSPYTLARHQQLIADMQCNPRVSLQVLGQTLDGHDLDLLRLGDPSLPLLPYRSGLGYPQIALLPDSIQMTPWTASTEVRLHHVILKMLAQRNLDLL